MLRKTFFAEASSRGRRGTLRGRKPPEAYLSWTVAGVSGLLAANLWEHNQRSCTSAAGEGRMRRSLLESLDLPKDLKNLSQVQMDRLAAEVRDLIVEVVSANGGHLAASLGVVELTLALLSVMDVPEDKIVWDVGHQCYAYKVLTDRRDRFATLRQAGGLSGFPRPSESCYDCFATGHASTAISAALGMARARDLAGQRHKVVAVVGDGALGGGMAWEAINAAGDSKADLLVILNDNKMSISPSIGALATHIARLRSMPLYREMEHGAERFFRTIPFGGVIKRVSQSVKRGLTHFVSPTSGTIFEALGFDYFGPINGHDIGDLKHFISVSRESKGPVLLHVVTTKGKGYHRAEHRPRRYHGVGPFNSDNGKDSERGGRSYTEAFGGALVKLAAKDTRIVAITAAMPDGTGLARFARKYPSRFFDVGIAEQHAVTFAAGLAASGSRPVVAIYSTFLQRAYDQIVHDVCMQNLPVIFALDRAGIVGEDGPTHHGVFDLSYLRHIPNLTIMAPKDAGELASMLHTALRIDGPVALRYPKGLVYGKSKTPMRSLSIGKAETLCEGDSLAIIAIGPIVLEALSAAEELAEYGIDARVINARFVKPLDDQAIVAAARECGAIVLAEENVGQGGFAGAVLECLARHGELGVPIETIALPDSFVGFGKASELRAVYGLSKQGILSAAERLLVKIDHPRAPLGDEFAIRQSI